MLLHDKATRRARRQRCRQVGLSGARQIMRSGLTQGSHAMDQRLVQNGRSATGGFLLVSGAAASIGQCFACCKPRPRSATPLDKSLRPNAVPPRWATRGASL